MNYLQAFLNFQAELHKHTYDDIEDMGKHRQGLETIFVKLASLVPPLTKN